MIEMMHRADEVKPVARHYKQHLISFTTFCPLNLNEMMLPESQHKVLDDKMLMSLKLQSNSIKIPFLFKSS